MQLKAHSSLKDVGLERLYYAGKIHMEFEDNDRTLFATDVSLSLPKEKATPTPIEYTLSKKEVLNLLFDPFALIFVLQPQLEPNMLIAMHYLDFIDGLAQDPSLKVSIHEQFFIVPERMNVSYFS